MNPFVSWGIVLAMAVGSYLYYTQSQKPSQQQQARGRSSTGSEGSQQKSGKREARAKRKPGPTSASEVSGSDAPFTSAREHEDSSAAEEARKRKAARVKALQVSAQGSPEQRLMAENDGASTGKDLAADQKWAESMLKVRQGAKLAPPSKNAARVKTVKTKGMGSNEASSASSTTGADADAEMSPAVSPGLPAAGDVSDMLEPSQPGPSVLRLTEGPNRPAPRAKPAPKEFQVAETKKQRQNRLKNEERKAANADAEADRQKLLEQQRRTARESRGEPAKNGMQQARAPASSAWTSQQAKPGATASTQQAAAPAVQPLLDTFDRAEQPAVGNAQASVVPIVPPTAATSTAGTTNGAAKSTDFSNGMSEHDQLAAATKMSEDESGWSAVTTKKGRGKASTPQVNGGRVAAENKPAASTAVGGAVAGRYAGLDVEDS